MSNWILYTRIKIIICLIFSGSKFSPVPRHHSQSLTHVRPDHQRIYHLHLHHWRLWKTSNHRSDASAINIPYLHLFFDPSQLLCLITTSQSPWLDALILSQTIVWLLLESCVVALETYRLCRWPGSCSHRGDGCPLSYVVGDESGAHCHLSSGSGGTGVCVCVCGCECECVGGGCVCVGY